jgi:hypothetical protein
MVYGYCPDLPPYANSTMRKEILRKQWGFECTCKLCTASPKAKKASDVRLARIEKIIEDLNISLDHRAKDPEKAELLVKLHEQEKLWGPLAGAQMYAALENDIAGRKERAKFWAAKALHGLKLWSGQGHEFHTRMLRVLGQEPEPGEHLYTRLF